MADLTDLQSAQAVKIAGANPSTGVEDNFMEVDSSGRLTAKLNDGSGNSITSTTISSKTGLDVNHIEKITYSATIFNLNAVNTPTDICTIAGSGTKTIKVTRIGISASQNTSATRDILLIKRSTLNSGGTSSTATVVPYDSNFPAGTATVTSYTANPSSLGTAVGTVRARRFQLLATNVTNPTDPTLWEFGTGSTSTMILRGTSENLAINLNGVTSSNNLFNITIEWIEE